ncbi:MAG: type transport system ATP-binding protein [Acidobacteriota bacterium]|jgi:ABC-2 type transport system ATP-binding protein|nr:type transport system ATP-binding protein [Acidobacteriota bacterium]
MIEAIDLTKRYDETHLALDALNLKVSPGEIYFMLGANGAGKTTVLNIFLNFVEPTSGRALINGIDVTKEPLEAKKYIAYVSEDLMLYGNFTARQNLDFFAKLGGHQGLKKDDCYQVLREVGLEEKVFDQKLKEFSKGMRQKVGLAIAIVKDAPAILLDELTSGLDPKVGAELMETLDQLRSRGKAILVATHDIFRAKEIADRIGIMKEGRKVMERTREELEQEDLQTLYLDYMRGGYRPEHRSGTNA